MALVEPATSCGCRRDGNGALQFSGRCTHPEAGWAFLVLADWQSGPPSVSRPGSSNSDKHQCCAVSAPSEVRPHGRPKFRTRRGGERPVPTKRRPPVVRSGGCKRT